MAVPSEKDLKKKEEFKASLIKSVGGEKLSEKKMCSILRGSVRKTWMMSPIRLLKLEQGRIADMNPDTRTKWLCKCEKCEGLFKMPDIEVDHIKGEHQLKSLSDVEQFARSILDVTLDDLQLFCKGCHEIKTYAERNGMTFDEATLEKKVIEWQKTTSTADQKKFLESVGYTGSPELISNNIKRKDAYRKHLQLSQ